MMEKIDKMLQDHSLCVLCTEGGGYPYCSLMTYMLSEDQMTLYMACSPESKKYKNLMGNPKVSVLIDNRQNFLNSIEKEIISVTFEGIYAPVEQAMADALKTKFAARHPELDEIIRVPSGIVIGIKLISYLMLNGPINIEQGIL